MEKRVTFAIKGLVFKDNKFLIVKRADCNNPDIWELPGGHLEFGETAETAVIREMKEEVNMSVVPRFILGTWNSYLHRRQITGIIYLCETNDEEVTLSDEHLDYKWVSHQDDDFKLLHPIFRDQMESWNWENLKNPVLHIT